MEYVRTFLESSSIAGFNHISTSRKGWRIFWIIVVTFGFCTAGFLIYESFKSWDESPIQTTLETSPISEMRFPKVTVCPPKDTYTDLNYNVMVADNLTKSIDSYDLYLYAKNVVKDQTFLDKFNKIQELNGFHNWYHGYTYKWYSKNARETRYSLFTYATSGSISTPYFREKFNPSLVEKEFILQMTIYPPNTALDNPNITFHLKIEKNILRGISRTSFDRLSITSEGLIMMGEASINEDTVKLTTRFTQKRKSIILTLNRKITSDDLSVNNLDSIPGFNMSWWYTGAEVRPDDHNDFMNENKTLLFRR